MTKLYGILSPDGKLMDGFDGSTWNSTDGVLARNSAKTIGGSRVEIKAELRFVICTPKSRATSTKTEGKKMAMSKANKNLAKVFADNEKTEVKKVAPKKASKKVVAKKVVKRPKWNSKIFGDR